MSKPQKLFDPESLPELLLGWLVHAHKGRDRHDLAARVYERGRYVLGIPTLLASTIVGTSVFSTLSSPGAPPTPLWVGLFSVLAAILAALQTFLDLPTRSERHRATGVKYKAAIRELEQMRAALAPGTAPPVDEIRTARALLDGLEDQAPVIMPRIFATIERRYSKVVFVRQALGLYD